MLPGDGSVATIVAALSYWNCTDAVWPTDTDAVWAGTAVSWSPTPEPSMTLTVYVPAGRNAKYEQPSLVVCCVTVVGPVT